MVFTVFRFNFNISESDRSASPNTENTVLSKFALTATWNKNKFRLKNQIINFKFFNTVIIDLSNQPCEISVFRRGMRDFYPRPQKMTSSIHLSSSSQLSSSSHLAGVHSGNGGGADNLQRRPQLSGREGMAQTGCSGGQAPCPVQGNTWRRNLKKRKIY